MSDAHSDKLNRIAGFRLLEEIARGGMGSVYRACQMSIGRVVAVKLLAPRFVEDRVFVERFLREARAAARLNHPNIVQAIDAGEADGRYYFAMEFVEGATLAALLRERTKLPPAEACEIIIQIARALEHAARFEMLHLDVKPANIMLTPTGLAKLADFGLARHVKDEDAIRAEKKVIFGTPGYMPPEQVRGAGNLDKRSDLYSLGVTFHELVTGRNPFTVPSIKATLRRVLAANVRPAHEVEPSVPLDMSLVIAKMMAPNRDERYADPTELMVDLDALSRLQPPPIVHNILPSEKAEETEPRRRAKRRVLVSVALFIVVFSSVLAALLASRQSGGPGPGERSQPPPALALYRECVINADGAMAENRFADAVRLYEDFAVAHDGTSWADDARYGADDARNRAVQRAREISAEVDVALDRDDVASAEELANQMVALGLPETQPLADDARKRIRRAEKTALHRARQERRRAARAALGELQDRLKQLVREGRFSEAAGECEKFLDNDDYTSCHAPARLARERIQTLRRVQQAVLVGAVNSFGYQLQGEPVGATVIGVRNRNVLLRLAGSEMTVAVEKMAAADLLELARRGEDSALPLEAALALLLYAQERYADTLTLVLAARNGPASDLRGHLDEVERESLLRLAQETLDAGRPRRALEFLSRLKRQYGASAFCQENRSEMDAIFAGATQLLTDDMAYISAGHFLFQKSIRQYLPAFYIDKHEVSNAEYAEFLNYLRETGDRSYDHPAQPSSKQGHVPLEWTERAGSNPNHPVVGVDWYDAFAYARWRGKRLPTEKEWEKAARGKRGLKYPWGDSWEDGICNAPPRVAGTPADLPGDVTAVGSFPQSNSPYGCADMAGNAREWIAGDLENLSEYVPVRGGSYKDSAAACATTKRLLMSRLKRDLATGFRCAMTPIENLP